MFEKMGDENLRPNLVNYNILIDVWAKSGERGAGEKAEGILNEIWRLCKSGDSDAKPDITSFNIVLNCLAKEGNGRRAQSIVDLMEETVHQPGFEHLRPNAITYNTVIDAWANSGEKGADERALKVLKKMEWLYKAGDTNVKPTIISFNAVLKCLAKEGNASMAQAIVDHMKQLVQQEGFEDLRPDTITYSTVADAWSKSGERGAGKDSLEILRWMERLCKAGDTNVIPGIQSYNIVLNCLAKEGNATIMAQEIMDQMEELMQQKGSEDLHPNTITYSTLIDAWTINGNEVGVAKIEAILNKMKDERKWIRRRSTMSDNLHQCDVNVPKEQGKYIHESYGVTE